MEDLNGWRKSSYSGNGGECVEAGHQPGSVMVRDTKLDQSPVIKFSASAWRWFTERIKAS